MMTERARWGIRPLQLVWGALIGLGGAALLGVGPSIPLADRFCVGVLMGACLVSGLLAYQLVRRNLTLMWSPIPWFLAASGLYFGFGPLILFLGNLVSVESQQTIWHATTRDVLRVTLLNAIGVAGVLGAWSWKARRAVTNNAPLYPWRQRPGAGDLILVFYLIGLPARAIATLHWFGMVPFTVPGFLNWVANFSGAGLVLLSVTTFSRRGGWWLVWGFMAGLEVLFALTTFSKLAIALSVFPCLVGYFLYRPELRVARWIAIALALLYLASVPFVTWTRTQALQQHSIQDRISLARSYLDEQGPEEASGGRQNWWSRLNYANLQAFAMTERDEGRPGTSFRLAAIAWIPRIIWPNKPVFESGYGFYTKLTGQENVSFGMGLFAEAYWNGGWLFVILMSLGVGWVYGAVTVQVVRGVTAGNLWVLPIALLWMRIGMRVDGWFHTEIVGPAVFTLLYFALLRFWQPQPASPRPRRRVRNRRANESKTVPSF